MRSHRQLSSLPHRALAAIGAALVLALTVFAASPAAHSWLHAAGFSDACPQDGTTIPASSDEDPGCVIDLFATSVDTPVAGVSVPPPRVSGPNTSPVSAADFYLVSPHYLRQPERGPPSNRVV